MFFWLAVIVVGLVGAVADVAINQWSLTDKLRWWVVGAGGYLLFMTALGLTLKAGMVHGYPLTIALVLVLLANIAFVAGWDVIFLGTSLGFYQWLGILLAIGAVACFELGAVRAK